MNRLAKGKGQGYVSQPNRSNISDPYISAQGCPEPAICPTCHAVYTKKHWTMEPKVLAQAEKDPKVQHFKCPACRKIEDHYPLGIVKLSGEFVSEHHDEIIGLIKNDEKRAMERNPLERIMKIEKANGGLNVETTTDDLAVRIGRSLCSAYKGEEKLHLRYEDKYVVVDWNR